MNLWLLVIDKGTGISLPISTIPRDELMGELVPDGAIS